MMKGVKEGSEVSFACFELLLKCFSDSYISCRSIDKVAFRFGTPFNVTVTAVVASVTVHKIQYFFVFSQFAKRL